MLHGFSNNKNIVQKILAGLSGLLFVLSAHAYNYRDLNYQLYVTNTAPYTVYINSIPKQLELHMQSGMPEIPLQQYPLEPTASAVISNSCTQAAINFTAAQISTATLASSYTRVSKFVFGDWNSDGKRDFLALGPLVSCSGVSNYLLIDVINNGYTTAPTLNAVPVPVTSELGLILQRWAAGTMVPDAYDNTGNNGAPQSLEFISVALSASGNPNADIINIIPPVNGVFTASSTTIERTGDETEAAALADVNGPDPSQIMPRAIGATGGTHTVALDGSASYQIPITVAPATGSVQPSLALNYSSNAGNSNMGFGWSLSGQSKISRCGKNMKQDGVNSGVTFSTADQLCLDGQRLILMSGTHGASGALYRLENEVFANVVVAGTGADGMPTSLTVQMSDGSIATYGGTSDSKIMANGANAGKILEWAQSQMKDRYSNYRDYKYTQVVSNGSYVMREIDYGGNITAATAHPYKVTFDYTANPIGYQGYLNGSTMSSPQLLKQVSIYEGNTELRMYALRYQPAQQYGEAYLMESVTECSGSGYCLSPTKFTWSTAGSNSFASPVASATDVSPDSSTLESYVDMNGDGLPDRVWLVNVTGVSTVSSMWVSLSTGSGFATPAKWADNTVGYTYSGPNYPVAPSIPNSTTACSILSSTSVSCSMGTFADVNGDGLPDYIYVPPTLSYVSSLHMYWITMGSQVYVALNTGSALQAPTVWLNTTFAHGFSLQPFTDVNGDGLVDFIFAGSCPSACDVEVALSTGTSFATPTVWLAAGSLNNYPATVIDVNGDGLPDRVWIPLGSSDIYVALNTGSGFATPSIWLNHTTLGYSIMATDGAWQGYADMNGDGMADRYWIYDYGDGPELIVALSDGTKFLTPYIWFYNTVVDARPQAGQGLTFADVNDDGLVDMLWIPNTQSTQVEVALQSAGSFGRPTAWLSGITASTTNRQSFVDINGDGLLDFAWFPGGSTTSVNVALSQAKPMSELKTITNGFGHQVTFTYDSLTNTGDPTHPVYSKGDSGVTYPNSSGQPYLQIPRRVVSHIDASNGIGGFARSTYHYTGLREDTKTKQNLGFAQISVLNEVTGLQDITTYIQDTTNNQQGMINETKTVDTATGYVLSDTGNTWQVNVLHDSANTAQSRYIRQLQSTGVSKRDLLNNLLYSEYNTYTYDSYGHILTQTTQEMNSAGTWIKGTTINNTYINDTTLWLLGLSDTVIVTNDVGGNAYSDGYDPAPISRASSWAYDSLKRLQTETIWTDSNKTTALNITTHSNYDNFGHALITTVSGPDFVSRSSSVTYDSSGRYILSATNALNQSVSSTYYNNSTISSGAYPGLVQTSTDLNGIVTTFTYDGFGRPKTSSVAGITSTNAFVNCTTLISDCSSIHATYATTSTSTGGTTSIAFYDVLGRVVRKSAQIQDGTTVYVDNVFDSSGNNTQSSEPYIAGATPLWNTTVYDKLGRITSSTEQAPGGTRTDTVTYSAYSVTTHVDAAGLNQQHIETKNALGQLVSVTDNASKVLRYHYNSNGALTQTIDSKGNTITIGYDNVGRKISMNDPDKGIWTYTYNGLGQLITQTNASYMQSCTAYDLLGRTTQRVEYYTGTATDALNNCANPGAWAKISNWVYDSATNGIGKLVSESLGTGYPANEYSQSIVYDSLSRVQTINKTIKGQSYSTTTTYDSLSRPSVLTYPAPNGSTPLAVQYNYNTLGFLTTINDVATPSLVYYTANQMDARGHITNETFGNGVTTSRSYDANNGNLTDISTTHSSTNLQGIHVVFDKLGNLTNRSDSATGFSEDFAYDNMDRLTSSTANFGNSDVRTQTANYDELGNLSYRSDVGTYVYGTATATPCANGSTRPHAVCSISGTKNATYVYDANGNMTSGDGRAMTWNTVNELPTQITRNSTTSTISYGPEKNRYFRQDINSATSTTTNTTQVDGLYEKVATTNGTTNTDEKYYIGGFAVLTIHNRGASQTQNTRYLHKDHLGSITAISDESGNIAELHNYDSWGNRRSLNYTTMNTILGVQWTSTLINLQPISNTTTQGYTGHEMFDGVNLIHMNGRVYDPEIGRFLSADPTVQDLTDMQAFNRYTYVRNNPLSLTDPSGYSWVSKHWHKLLHSVGVASHIAVAITKMAYLPTENSAKDAIRQIGRVFAQNPLLTVVADAVAVAFGQVWLVPLINAAVAASVTYESTGSFSASLRNGAIAYAASAVTMEAGGMNAFGSMTAVQMQTAATMGNFVASMAVGGAISKAQGGKFFDSKTFIESMAISWAVSHVMGSTAKTDANQKSLTDGGANNEVALGGNDIGGSGTNRQYSCPLPNDSQSLEYSQRGYMYLDDDVSQTSSFFGSGNSGNGNGLNNPAENNSLYVGPIQRGNYTIETQWDNTAINRQGTVIHLPGSMRLDPLFDVNPRTGNYLIHGGTYSEGCILMTPNLRNSIGNSGITNLRVTE